LAGPLKKIYNSTLSTAFPSTKLFFLHELRKHFTVLSISLFPAHYFNDETLSYNASLFSNTAILLLAYDLC